MTTIILRVVTRGDIIPMVVVVPDLVYTYNKR